MFELHQTRHTSVPLQPRNVGIESVAQVFRIWEFPGSYLDSEVAYPDSCFVPLPGHAGHYVPVFYAAQSQERAVSMLIVEKTGGSFESSVFYCCTAGRYIPEINHLGNVSNSGMISEVRPGPLPYAFFPFVILTFEAVQSGELTASINNHM